MPSSQEFREALQAGKIQEAFTLALTEAVELKITTWVSSSEPESETHSDGDVAAVKTTATTGSPRSVEAAKPGYRLRSNINLMQGDIENEIGDRFLKNNAYHELLQFHFTQVDKGQQIIEQNIQSLQKIFSLVTSLNQPAPDNIPASPPVAIAPEPPRSESPPVSEGKLAGVEIPEETIPPEGAVTSQTLASAAIAMEESGLNENVLESLVEAEEQIQQMRSDSWEETELSHIVQDAPPVAIAPETNWLEEEDIAEPDTPASPSLVPEEESAIEPSLSEEELEDFNEPLELSEDWLEEEESPTIPSVAEDLSLTSPRLDEEKESEALSSIAFPIPQEEETPPDDTLRSPEEIWDAEVADNQTEAFIDTLFSSDDWIEGELPEPEEASPLSPEEVLPKPSGTSEQLEIEGWGSSNLRLNEPLIPETAREETPKTTEELLAPPETSEPDIFQFEDLTESSESEENLELDDWEFSSEGTETESPTGEKAPSPRESALDELAPETDRESLDLEDLASDLTLDSQPTREAPLPSPSHPFEPTVSDFGDVESPWDAPEPEISNLEAFSLDEIGNEEDNEEEDEDWGDFVKFVEQDLPAAPTPNASDLPEKNPLAIASEQRAPEDAIALAEEWDASSEIDPFAVSQSDTESYTSIVEEDWEEFAIEELEPYPKSGDSSLPDPLLEETLATASIDEILGDPPALIDEEISEFSDNDVDLAWDEELFGDEFNFDISLSDEADIPSNLLGVEAKHETNHNT
ncbi:MAG: hypothetical protein AB4290_13485 [Spirulina sp.]